MWKKVPIEVKMEALKLLQTGESFQSVSKRLRIGGGELKTWSLVYEKEGEKGLALYPKNICTGKIKDKIICTYREKRVPLHTLSAKYHVPYSSVVSCISTYRRKGNCLDNSIMENFFGLLKNEFYYANHFDDEQTFLKGLADYIKYYNNDRIKLRLSMSPVQYRQEYTKNISMNTQIVNNI